MLTAFCIGQIFNKTQIVKLQQNGRAGVFTFFHIQGVFPLGLPLKVPSTEKLILGVSRTIYVNVDSPNLGSPCFNILGEAQCKKNTMYLPYPRTFPYVGEKN